MGQSNNKNVAIAMMAAGMASGATVTPDLSTKTADYNILASDEFSTIVANKSSAITFNLPDITGEVRVGWYCYIYNIGSGTLTIDGYGSDTIDGNSTITLIQYEGVRIQVFNATSWITTTEHRAPTEEQVFDQAKNIITAGSNVTVANNDINNTITINSTGSGGSSYNPTLSVKTANYNVVNGDKFNTIVMNSSSNRTINMPDITSPIAVGWYCRIYNNGSGTLTIDGHGSDTIDNSNFITLDQYEGVLIQAYTSTRWITITEHIPPTEEEVFDQAKNIIEAGVGNVSITDNDTDNTIKVGYRPGINHLSGGSPTSTAEGQTWIYRSSSNLTANLPEINTTTVPNGWSMHIVNEGTGTVTLDPNGSQKIDGASTFVLNTDEGVRIIATLDVNNVKNWVISESRETPIAITANPGGSGNSDLNSIGIGGTNYDIPSGGGGGGTPAVSEKTANYTIVAGDEGDTVIANSSTALTFTLPDITGNVGVGFEVTIYNKGSANLSIDGNGTDTIREFTGTLSPIYYLESKRAVTLQVESTTQWLIKSVSQPEFFGVNVTSTSFDPIIQVPPAGAIRFIGNGVSVAQNGYYANVNIPGAPSVDFSTLFSNAVLNPTTMISSHIGKIIILTGSTSYYTVSTVGSVGDKLYIQGRGGSSSAPSLGPSTGTLKIITNAAHTLTSGTAVITEWSDSMAYTLKKTGATEWTALPGIWP